MNKKILIIDDNKLNVRLLQEILQDEHYDVFTLDEGSNVLKICGDIEPDAVLLDIMMPGIDGFDVCRLLKSDYNTKDIPVIMVTAKTEAEDLRKAFDIGAFDYIRKPINEVEVLARLKSALRYKEQQEKLKDMAMKDGLTGLFNHTLLIELLKKEYDKAQRNNNCLAFLMIDVDHFKSINDNYGHIVGDNVIRGLANILVNNARQSDIVGRYGGEEFGIVLPDISLEDAEMVSYRIRSSVEENTYKVEDQVIHITASIGLCYKHQSNSTTYHDMIKYADKALYKAKKNGRNQVVTIVLD